MTQHEVYIKRCLQIAKNGLGRTRPNPMVGSVIVHNNNVIGEGFTSPYGDHHAEVNAINSVKNTNMLVIDGCTLDCGKKTFEKNGLTNFRHLRLTDLGYEKGKTKPSEEVISRMYKEAIFMV